ncbi:MAG: ADP-ribosylglycohydrolase family protein [Bacillota bacterium]
MINHYRGCLIGGAVGDALGWPVEFMHMNDIKRNFGEHGITDLVIANNGYSEITDDTQMTIFTIEGLLRAENRGRSRGVVHTPSMVHKSYLRWLATQGVENPVNRDGWVYGLAELHTRRAPGNTCLSALASGQIGEVSKPINESKGCGGVMRTAPVGLFYDKKTAFQFGCDIAAITHGHPSGYLSSGALSYLIAAVLETSDLSNAVELMLEELKAWPNHEECSEVISKAVQLAAENHPDSKAIEILGEGWVGEEALAISIYCALKYQNDFRAALIAAVNHNGDSDSTGAITGNILGALLGIESIPEQWVKGVELSRELLQLADDLFHRYDETEAWQKKYPGW